MSEEAKKAFEADPGSASAVIYAKQLIAANKTTDAMAVLMKGLSANPNLHLGRLLLAKLYFGQGYIPFAAKEIKELCRQAQDNTALKRLLQKLEPTGTADSDVQSKKEAAKTDAVIAETDFDFGEIDLLDKK